MAKAPVGEVRISPKVASGAVGDQFLLLHVPNDRFIVLNEFGQRLWEKIQQGTRSISTLSQQHSEEASLPFEVAAFQVIAFLDELRAEGFVSFTLDRERITAPLLDVHAADLLLEELGQPPPLQAQVAEVEPVEARPRPKPTAGKSRSACKTMCR